MQLISEMINTCAVLHHAKQHVLIISDSRTFQKMERTYHRKPDARRYASLTQEKLKKSNI